MEWNTKGKGTQETERWSGISDKCRYCTQTLDNDFEITYSYWGANMYPCHSKCQKEGEATEALACQAIDADCNDCKFFNRKEGKCEKTGKPAKARPKFASLHECFEHRKG